eukprot:TRINITY_DN15034_c0_g1_i1.p1 TRINITY_DN15034_c0_g1~~TRINITY_DN15034_c0_g1_i1.p1  ORF type:complete len:334 (-),score=98.38 TRINITY_DN15034_c0_g1_i1:46-1047(-)
MYLDTVLNDIKKESTPPKTLHAEHLFKLNEAIFNLPENDTVDKEMASRLFKTVEKIRVAHNRGKYDDQDSNFFYDYLALLGTMQNQPCFTSEQTEQLLSWIREVVDDGNSGSGGAAAIRELQAQNDRLKQRLAVYEDPQPSKKGKAQQVAVVSAGKKSAGGKGGKAPQSGYDKHPGDYEEQQPPKKGDKGEKGKAKGKGDSRSGKGPNVEPEPRPPKGKGKKGKGAEEKGHGKDNKGSGKGGNDAKAAEKGKGKGKDKDMEDEPKGKGKAKPTGKKGKGKDETPPEQKGKGKGKGKYGDGDDEGSQPPAVRGEQKAKAKGRSGKGKKWKATDD